ncbi:MAG: DUF1127 domain-containing protein [Geminicoccaceae bacterium]
MSTFDLAWWLTRRRVSGLAVWLRRAADILLTWRERAHQRRHLRALNDHMLRDIGLTRADVMAESSKPFWRL